MAAKKKLIVFLCAFAALAVTGNLFVIHTFGFHSWMLLLAAAVIASLIVVVTIVANHWIDHSK